MDSPQPNAAPDACGPDCGCSPTAMPRRRFLALSVFTVAASALSAFPVMAGPFEASDFAALIPPDKKLHADWVRALTARGERAVYTKKRGELNFIGLPIGGLCCGTLYLSGDGRLWAWDIFNQNKEGILPRNGQWKDFSGHAGSVDPRNGASYVEPHEVISPLEQGFALQVDGVTRPLTAAHWESVSFTGEYPLGLVTYADPKMAVTVTLTAYSPFIPLNADDSGLPATICEFTLHNTGTKPVKAEIGGWLENAVSLYSAQPGSGSRANAVRQTAQATLLTSRFDPRPVPRAASASARPDILIDDFERDTYAPWTTTGTAFGSGPVLKSAIPGYQGDIGGHGRRVVNSHAAAPGADSDQRDRATGTLTSPPVTIERDYLTFDIGGGSNVDQVGLRLIVDGQTVRRATGRNDNHMGRASLDVREFAGKTAQIEIYDQGTGGWGNVGVDDIVQTDVPLAAPPAVTDRDYGTLALALHGYGVGKCDVTPETVFSTPASGDARKAVGDTLIGGITKSVPLAPGASQTLIYVVAWHFPNSGLGVSDAKSGNYYAKRFPDAAAVASYVMANYPRLAKDTKLWHSTWYDSTLPRWFLDRTFANTSILATTTAHRFATGRFWGWEGVGCCEGTCTHVWHYAQAVGRLFPELERYTREHVDFGVALDEKTGKIGFRGEGTGPAVDGQCGRILGVLREHQMSADDAFLKRLWPKVKEALTFLMGYDKDGEGFLEGAQDNTLDAAWYGKIAWLSSLYAAALRACEVMATETGDAAFATLCRRKFEQTKAAIETQLFNGEYFIQIADPAHADRLGTYQTCHIDQVHGQSWAWQVNLGRVLDQGKTVSALRALYKYNFAPDVGPFRRHNTAGRPYALAGDAGLVMVTNPQDLPHPFGDAGAWQVGYFNECMTGFEHQAASHMLAEGLVQEGLAVTRAVHDRYHPRLRNPYNEIECSDHYSRAMASYGSFITLCGFEYHGPRGHLGFAPRLTPDDFKAPFTAAEGWGTFAQHHAGPTAPVNAAVLVRHGRLRLSTLALVGPTATVTATLAGRPVPASVRSQAGRALVTFPHGLTLQAGQELTVSLTG